MEKNFKRKFLLTFLGILILIVGGIGITYGYWINSETQNTFDILGVKCFELTMTKETEGIHLEEAYPVTDEEGKEQEGYQFTIKNTCNTSATYQVNLEEKDLEESIKRLSDEYIKVSLNDSTGKNLDDYESTEATIKEEDFQADKSHKLTSGSLGPNEEETYTLKLWMDYDTPAIDSVMNAAFESKISVVATYIEDDKRKNTIAIDYEEQENYSNISETITFTAESENKEINIIEYSLDGEKYEPIELVEGKASPKVNISLEFTKEQEYTIYFKDSLGNIKEQAFTPSKLDQTGPEIHVEETNDDKGAVLTITFEDLKSGLKEYRIEDGISRIDLEEEWTLFNETNKETITYPSSENKTIHIYAKDKLDNLYDTEYTITKADTKGPELTISNPKENEWTNGNVTINLSATDEISGVDKFYYSKDVGDTKTWTEINEVELNEKNGTATLTISDEGEQTIYIKAEDKLGNVSTIGETTVKIDLSAPTQKFELDNTSENGDNDWYKNASITVTGTDTGGSNIVSGSYCEGTSNCEPTTPIVGLSESISLSDGINKVVCVTFTDNAGNTSKKTCSQTYNVDGEAPTISSLNAPTEWGASNTLTANVEDIISGIAGYLFSVDNTTPTIQWTTVSDHPTGSTTYMGTANSNTTWYFYVKDQAGNVSRKEVEVNKVDNGLPRQEFSISPAKANGDNGWYKGTRPTITITAADDQSGVTKVEYCTTTDTNCTNYTNKLQLNGQNGELNRTGTLTLLEGSNSKVCVKVTDGVGKTSEGCSSGYNIDITAPTIGSVTGSLKDTSITFTANNVTETGSGTQIYSWTLSDQKTQTSEVNTATFTGLTEGQSYTATVTVVDNAGNISTGVTSNSVKIPKTVSLAGMKVPLAETGDGLYEVTHSAPEGWTASEYRYAGKDPNNYVTFNNEKAGWRIIGLVNVKTTNNKIEQRIKIIRADSIGDNTWDSGNVNDWTQASLMTYLNVGGTYYSNLNTTAQGMIATDIIWNLGGSSSYNNVTVSQFYERERGTTVYSSRPTEWDPKKQSIALPYPSDYGYATSGGSTGRTACFAKELYNWDSGAYKTDCAGNDWLKPGSGWMWTLSPTSSTSGNVFYVHSGGRVSYTYASGSHGVWPTLYLSSSVSISGGTGTSSSPYQLLST